MATEGRYYEAEFPEMEEIVVVQVKRIVDMGAYVSLLEYDNQEAFHCLCCICSFYFCHHDLFATIDSFMSDFLAFLQSESEPSNKL